MEKSVASKLSPAWVLLVVGAMVWWASVGSHDFRAHDYDISEVDVTRAHAMIDAGAIVIDARSESSYGGRHIPGAMLIPLAVLRAGIPLDLLALREREIVVYCNKGRHIGPEATHLLNEAGFARAVNLESGIEGWAAAGQPVEGS